MLYAGFYVLLAIFSPRLVRLFLALPPTVIAAFTGLALIPALLGAMKMTLTATTERDAAILTFRATGSGLTLFELGSIFWGLVADFCALGAGALLKRI